MNNKRQEAMKVLNEMKANHGVAWKVNDNTYAAVVKLPNNDTCIVWAGTAVYGDRLDVLNKFHFLCAEYLMDRESKNTMNCTLVNAGTDDVELRFNGEVFVSKNTLTNPELNLNWESPNFEDFKKKNELR